MPATKTRTPKPKTRNPKLVTRNSHADFLLEIGTEELPAAYLPGLIEQLRAEATALFHTHHLSSKAIQSFGTPRRLVLLVRELISMQRKPAEEIRGPSKQAAYDAAGKPTKALLGFLRSRGGTVQQTKLVSSEKGDYVYLRKPPTAIPTAKVLPELLTPLIGRLRAPKTMRWDGSGARFARPIRWVLALYGTQPLRCSIGTLTSAPRTRIGRPQALRGTRVASIPGYVQTLKRAGLMLDHGERRRRIQELVERQARRVGGVIAPEMISHGLLDEVTHLVEQPIPLTGSYDPKYLVLPRAVLLASMAKYQRVFAIQSKGEKLLPRFVAILDGKSGKPKTVQAIIERILNARLADSLMFWNKDRRCGLEHMTAAGIMFHEGLGNMVDKVNRLAQMSRDFSQMWGLQPEEREQLSRASRLAKNDLDSAMVKAIAGAP